MVSRKYGPDLCDFKNHQRPKDDCAGFIAGMIMRIPGCRLGGVYPEARIRESLFNVCGTSAGAGVYLFYYSDKVIKAVEKEFNLNLTKRVRSSDEIKKLSKETKKHPAE